MQSGRKGGGGGGGAVGYIGIGIILSTSCLPLTLFYFMLKLKTFIVSVYGADIKRSECT